jgi:phosphopantothenoylcysteine decarboxylase/phosphopantothenate--cysteine ligase
VSGGIAAYKALEFVRLATGGGACRARDRRPPASSASSVAASFAALTGRAGAHQRVRARPALRGAFPGDPLPERTTRLSHLALVAAADAFLIAPASANTIAKLASGLADNLLTSAALAARCPLLVAPAMNTRMYEHPATQANLQLLRERGIGIVEPGVGRLASHGEQGVGRLAEPRSCSAACEAALSGQAPALTARAPGPPRTELGG